MIERKATLKDIAKLAKNSTATASIVLSQGSNKYVSEQLRQQVLDAARNLKYRPNIAARIMKGKQGKTLAILVPQLDNVFFNRVTMGAETYASSRDYILSIYSTHEQEQRELKYLDNILAHQVDGILICPAKNRSYSVDLIREAGIPYVVIDRSVQGTDHDSVTIDNYQAAYQGAKLLIEHGHRNILVYGWKSKLDSITDRIKGFTDSLAEANIDRSEVMIIEGTRSQQDAFATFSKLMKQRQFTAVFATFHRIGAGIVEALRVANKRIPEDVSVLVFGNPDWATINAPQLSCIEQPDMEMGARAAELVISQIENPAHSFHHYKLATNIHIRDSIHMLKNPSKGGGK